MDHEDEQVLNLLNAPSSPESDAALNILTITDSALRAVHDGSQQSFQPAERDVNMNETDIESKPRSPPSSIVSDVSMPSSHPADSPTEDVVQSPGERVGNGSIISDLRSDSVSGESVDTSFTGNHVKKVRIPSNRLREIDTPGRLTPTGDEARAPSPPTRDQDQRRITETNPLVAQSPPTRDAPSPPVQDNPMPLRLQQGKPASTVHTVEKDAGTVKLTTPSITCYDVDTVPCRLVTDAAKKAESITSVYSAGSSVIDEANSRSGPEIYTVPENLVSIDDLSGEYSSTSSLYDENALSMDMSTSVNRKPLGGPLVQGTRVEAHGLFASDVGDVTSRRTMMTSQDDISVSQFDYTGKERGVRDVLKRRQEQSKPTKRYVQASIISSQKASDRYESAADSNVNNSAPTVARNDACCRHDLTVGTQGAITAAVAASAAVAVTQPYAKAQQDLDAKMSDVLDKLNNVHATKRDALTSSDCQRIQELEKQLADLTQRRLDYIEKMQEHHMEWQNKMMTAQTKTSVAPQRAHYEYVTIRQTEVPVCLTQAGRRQGSTSDLRQQYREAVVEKKDGGRGRLLEDILGRTPNRRDVATSPLTSSAERNSGSDTKALPVSASYSPGVRDYVTDKLSRATIGPTPLDGYLRKPTELIPTSPYPVFGERRRELFETYSLSQVEAVLETLTKNKECLENNFRTLLKAKNDADVYNIVDTIAVETVGTEVARRRRMVDDCISHLSQEVKALVEDDLDRERLLREQAEQGVVIEEKKPLKKPRFGGRIQSRIDTGIRRVEAQSDVRSAPKGKENLPVRRGSKQPLAKPAYLNENYVTRVYGKASYQNRRTTVKNPYLHYKNPVSPPNRSTRPAVTQDVKAIAMKSARTQTVRSGATPHAPPHPVLPPGQPPVQYITVQGQRVPVAIALGPPRQGGTKEPIVIRTGTMPGEIKSEPDKKLEVKVLQSVEIDSESSEVKKLVPKKKKVPTASLR